MDSTHITQREDSGAGRKAAVSGLAIVGFVALILIGIATAIYAASFIPKALSRLGSANVYLSTQNGGADGGIVAVNPGEPAPTVTPSSPATTTAPAPVVVTTSPAPVQQPPTYTYRQPTYQTVPQPYYGRPDLVTSILSVGYLRRSGDTSSYIPDDQVPAGYQGAIRFSIANRGTDVSGTWNFAARLPSTSDSNYRSGTQRSLSPGDSIVFTLGFDGTDRGRSDIRITADSTDRVSESNENNNEDSETIYLGGSSTSNTTRDYDSNGNYCRYGTYYQNGWYYCDSQNTSINRTYDSFGNLCATSVRVYQNGIYTCDSATNYGSRDYDSNGNYCQYGTYYSSGRYYCS